jgi:lysophospholipase L1-like esterase
LVQAGTGRAVAASNLAAGGKTSTDLLAEVRSDASTRTAIGAADIVLLGIGGGDLNEGDAALAAGGCKGKACYEGTVATFSKNIGAIVEEISRIRGGKPTVLRAITLPNVLPGAEDVIPPSLVPVAPEVGPYTARGLRDATCTALKANGGLCIDAVTAFNGPGADTDAYKLGLLNHTDCCYPNEKGQGLMAQLLYATGLAPLVN